MVNRPLEDIRIVGPFAFNDNSDSEEDGNPSKEIEGNKESAIVEQAENWYKSISDKSKKKKMMVEYIYGITDDNISKSDAKQIVEKSGL